MSQVTMKDRGFVQLWQHLTNSPTWERDAAAITSPWRMGLWFFVLNGLLVAGLVTVYSLVSKLPDSSAAAQVLARMGLGRLFCGAIFLSLSFFLSIFVPIRVFGVLFTPRIGRYFDQIVLSGITPWRFIGGKIVGQQAFYLIVLVVCFPYLIFCLSFGGISLTEVVLYTAMIFVYVHVLIIASLAASMMMSELLALPLVIAVFTLSAVAGLAPMSPHPLNLTPTASIMSVFYETLASESGRSDQSGLFVGGFAGFTLFHSHLILYLLVSIAVLVLGGLAVTLGPINNLAQGLNTFGEAVLPGDRERAGWLKRRFNLRRQSELSFLYENNSPSWRAADFRRRWCLRESVFLLLIGSALIWLYWLFTRGFYAQAFYPLHSFLAVSALLLNALLFSESWVSERLTVGRWEAGRLNVICFAANAFLVWLGFAWAPVFWEMDLFPIVSRSNNEAFGHLTIQNRHCIALSLLTLVCLAFYTLMRAIIFKGRSKAAGFFITLFWMALIAAASGWIADGLEIPANANRPLLDAPVEFTWVRMGNPLTAADAVMSNRMLTETDGKKGIVLASVLYSATIVLTLFVAHRRRQQLRKRML